MYTNSRLRLRLLLSLFVVIILSGCSKKITRSYIKSSDITIEKEGSKQNEYTPGACNEFIHYIPDSADLTTMIPRRVRINIHFMNNEKGNVNFTEEEGRQYALDLVYSANQMLRQNQKMNLPAGNETPVVQPLYEFVLWPDPAISGDDGIYFHYDNDKWYMNKKNRGETLFSSKHYDTYGRQKGDVINIFLMEHPTDSISSPTYKASADGVGFTTWAKVVGCYQHNTEVFYWDSGKPIYKGAWYMAKLFNHELGHSLGLPHSWNTNDGCDDTPTHPNCWNYTTTPPCNEEISNNMMDYNQCQCALTPCQIGKIRSYMSRPNNMQRKFIAKDWCERDPANDITIYRGDSVKWIGHRDIRGNITIQPGGVLEITCTLSMPRDGKITVKPGATFIMNGSTITNTCGDQWEGIEIWQNGKTKSKVIARGNINLLNIKHPVDEVDNTIQH